MFKAITTLVIVLVIAVILLTIADMVGFFSACNNLTQALGHVCGK